MTVPSPATVRQAAVVELDQHAGSKPRQYVEEGNRRVGIHEASMRAVDEDDVARFERIEDSQVDLF